MARPIRQQVFGIAAVLAIVVVTAVLVASRITYQEQVQHLRAEALAMSTTVVAYLERNLDAADDAARIAMRHPDVQRLRPEAGAVLRPIVDGDPMIQNALIADLTGTPVVWSQPPDPAVQGQIPAGWLKEVAMSGRAMLSPVVAAPDHAAHALLTARPITDTHGAAIGVLALVVHLEALEAALARIPLPTGSVITVTDQESMVVARSLDARKFVGRPAEPPPSRPREFADVPATDVRVGIDGVERVYGNTVVARGPWLASVGIPTEVARQRTAPIERRNVLIMLGALAFVVLFSLFVTERALRALNELRRHVGRVAGGDLSPLPPQDLGSDELNDLHQGLAGMITNLRAAQDAVAAQVVEERRVRQEKEALQQQLIRQERLAAIGVLVSGVAHELNNPLQAILGFSELLQLHDDLPDSVKHDLGLIRRESTRASGIIRNLQRFGRQTTEPSPVRLSNVVASVLELRQRKIEAQGIRLDIEDQSEAIVSAVFTELQQVVLNFVINAEQAVTGLDPARRHILIRTTDGRNSARLEVEDHGDGVPAADEPKLFQPFFTTKPVGEGTGLGLSVSYGIITSHGGEIGYRPSPRGGAIFYFELPTR